MSQHQDELQAQIDDLARRITQLEELAVEQDEAVALDGQSASELPTPAAPLEQATPAPPEAPDLEAERRAAFERLSAIREGAARERVAARSAPAVGAAREHPIPTGRGSSLKPQGVNLEQFVGAKLFAVVGSLVIVVGAALLLKVAWDAGWFNMLSDQSKCVTGAVFGALLLVGGEVARRKINAFASIGCTAAGIGVLYASAFAAYGFFGLISHEAGFVLLASVAALGVLVGARARLASVSALSIIAAYAVPLFFLDVEPRPMVLPLYLSSILVIGLALSGMLGGRFAALRSLVWWGTVLYGGAWATLMGGGEHLAIALSFFAFAWAAIHAELIWSAARRGITGEQGGSSALDSWRAVRPIASSFSVTAWAALLGSVALFDATGHSWHVPASLACAVSVLASILGGGLRYLRETPENDRQRLACVFALETGALIIAAVALGLAGWLEAVAWLSLGVSAVLAGRLIRARPLDVYGLVVLALVTVRLVVLDRWFTAYSPDDITVAGMYLTRWTLLLVIDGAAWLLAATLLIRSVRGEKEPNEWRVIGRACVAVGISLVFASALHEETTRLATGWLLIACAAATLGASSLLGSKGLRLYSFFCPAGIGLVTLPLLWLLSGHNPSAVGDPTVAVEVSWYTAALLASAAYWFAAALLTVHDRDDRRWRHGVPWCTGFGLFFVYLTAVHPDTAASLTGWAWLAMSAGVWFAHRLAPVLHLRRWAVIGLIFAGIAWIEAYEIDGWSDIQAAPLMHPGLWLAVPISLVQLIISVRNSRAEPGSPPNATVVIFGLLASVGLLFWATTLEAGRVAEMYTVQEMSRRAAVSMWWGVFAIGLIAAGFWRNVPLVRHAGLGLLAVATSKAVIFDLTEVSAAWRAVSFLALGLMMLAVGLVYAKVSASVGGERDPV